MYDVQDGAEQDKIVSALEQLASGQHIPPFNVCFYDHEHWIVSGNFGERGPENKLKCVRVAAGYARQLSGAEACHLPNPMRANQALERTAVRRMFRLRMTKTFPSKQRSVSAAVVQLVLVR